MRRILGWSRRARRLPLHAAPHESSTATHILTRRPYALAVNMSAQEAFKRYVEVGRVVLVNKGEGEGKLAVIAEIVDHNKVSSSQAPDGKRIYSLPPCSFFTRRPSSTAPRLVSPARSSATATRP